MVYAAHFGGALLACQLVALALLRSGPLTRGWAWRSPRLAILCWQAIGLALGLSMIGLPLAVGLAPYGSSTGTALRSLVADLVGGEALPPGLGLAHLGLVGGGVGIAVVLLTSTAGSLVAAVRTRRRHREILDLVGRADPAVPGALVLDHPSAAAYCLPGVRPRVVVSAGTLDLLDRPQLAAVLSHERAHADERHDLVLLPFTALCRTLPWVRWMRSAHEMVALLVEMRADDKARRLHADGPLAAALLRFATAGSRVTPEGALGVADGHLDARVQRLLVTGRAGRLRGAVVLAVTAVALFVPVSLYLN